MEEKPVKEETTEQDGGATTNGNTTPGPGDKTCKAGYHWDDTLKQCVKDPVNPIP